ncbi:unnamed protein product [Prunus armeniaca]|uniref:Uncharacterized protein n=1 Tax=Prunus armeniaca TaxID=36596 RepID=A0A6J5VU82_PRUAR|nr:unnamed protein product [Prunus armeniaca]
MVKVCEACEGQGEEDDGAVTEPDLARVGKHRILDLPERYTSDSEKKNLMLMPTVVNWTAHI